MTSISIIIPNLHSPLVGEVIAALRAQTARDRIAEIVVVGQDRYGLVVPDDLVRPIVTERPVYPGAARGTTTGTSGRAVHGGGAAGGGGGAAGADAGRTMRRSTR